MAVEYRSGLGWAAEAHLSTSLFSPLHLENDGSDRSVDAMHSAGVLLSHGSARPYGFSVSGGGRTDRQRETDSVTSRDGGGGLTRRGYF